MIFGNPNMQMCRWSRCDKGVYRGYHTPIEWTQHEQYTRTDLPPPIYPSQMIPDGEVSGRVEAQPREGGEDLYYMQNTRQLVSSRRWQWLAVGTMVAVWITVIWSVSKLI